MRLSRGGALVAGILALLFQDSVTCAVQGYISRFQEADPVVLARADGCEGVRMSAEREAIVLYTAKFWVRIPIAPDLGHRRFLYRWGAPVAHLDADTISVQWGPVVDG